MAGTPVIITIPKYVTTGGSVFKDYVEFKSEPTGIAKGRKRRLDHLSWEEKLQRKKLKNRVAAQTSRDRKKQKMEEIESELKELMDRNDALVNECHQLQLANEQLSTENGAMRQQLALAQCSACARSTAVDCTLSAGPAESRSIRPRPQGAQRVQSAGVPAHHHQRQCRRQTTVTMLQLLLSCLLCPTCSPTSTPSSTSTSSRRSLRACSTISPQTWKQLLQRNRLRRVVAKRVAQDKWWGRHQSAWNPVGTGAR